ncbi:hypothetical protein BUALT_Bualt06G0015900 [Buddleja alternifolia]|uniref:CDP-diacylglycerol--glycerol-3-phosphate 1-phosphatidyltransferase n=1 Tax=Buddleja alternifolia TaxID=168488 RepID=A0AAV6XC65_9LAMI|nr:hypothetical protein BUALT_Bualt06G0015900 [Buddleja alternifolia]
MPGALKFPNLTILNLNTPKPHNILPNLPSSSATAIIQSTPILRRNYSAGWWRRAIPCPTAAQPKINPQIFRRDKSDLFSSDCGKRGRDGQFDLNLRTNLGTQMRATLNGKVDSQYYESDVSPRQNHPEKPPPSKLLTLPTILTIGRVAAVPLLVGTFYAETWWGPTVTTGIFIVAAFTDWLDGYLARKMNLGTPFGAFLDPVADKLMVAATLILLCTKPFEAGIFGQAQWLLTVPAIAIIGREITMSAVREWAASQDRKLLEAVAVNNLGKWKTAAQMISLTILLASRDGRYSYRGRTTCVLWSSVALHIGMACFVVIGRVHEKDMESAAEIVTFDYQYYFGSYKL